MKPQNKTLVWQQLDASLKRLEPLKAFRSPPKGLVRAVRDALGMTGRQLAGRLQVNKQRISRIEHDEKTGKIKLETLQKVAEALHCDFVYGFIPRNSLEQTVRNQARQVAERRMARTNQTMRLEKQELGKKEQEKALQDLTAEIVTEMPKSLWDEDHG